MSFSDNLKRFRNMEGLSQRKLAENLRVSPSLIALYETGERMPSFEMLCSLSEFFGVTVNDLIGDESEKADQPSDANLKFALFGDGNITDAQLEEVKRFAAYVKSRDQHGKP